MQEGQHKFSPLLKRIIAVISGLSLFLAGKTEPKPLSGNDGYYDPDKKIDNPVPSKKPILVLKLTSTDARKMMHTSHSSHQSHSSHSSHSSHYSSSTGSSGSSYSTPITSDKETYLPPPKDQNLLPPSAQPKSHTRKLRPSQPPPKSITPATAPPFISPNHPVRPVIVENIDSSQIMLSVDTTNNSTQSAFLLGIGIYTSATSLQLTPVQKKYTLGSRTLASGNTGTDVAELQALLLKVGYIIAKSGYFDEPTALSVESFQLNHKLPITGKIDRKTLAMLRKAAKNK